MDDDALGAVDVVLQARGDGVPDALSAVDDLDRCVVPRLGDEHDLGVLGIAVRPCGDRHRAEGLKVEIEGFHRLPCRVSLTRPVLVLCATAMS